jgi:hypothetical protein
MRPVGFLPKGGSRPERSSKSMRLRLCSEEATEVCRMRAEGEIRGVTDARNLGEIEEMLGPQCYRRKDLLDLQHAPRIDSSDISWLVPLQSC